MNSIKDNSYLSIIYTCEKGIYVLPRRQRSTAAHSAAIHGPDRRREARHPRRLPILEQSGHEGAMIGIASACRIYDIHFKRGNMSGAAFPANHRSARAKCNHGNLGACLEKGFGDRFHGLAGHPGLCPLLGTIGTST